MVELREYCSASNRSPYGLWFRGLDAVAAFKVVTAVTRLEAGNTSNVKAVGEGVNELRIDFGPGYRVYFGWDGSELVILLGGGTKKRQNSDIKKAQSYWTDYKTRKGEAQRKAAQRCH